MMVFESETPFMDSMGLGIFQAGTLASVTGTILATALPCLRISTVSPCSTSLRMVEACFRNSVNEMTFMYSNVHSVQFFVKPGLAGIAGAMSPVTQEP